MMNLRFPLDVKLIRKDEKSRANILNIEVQRKDRQYAACVSS